MLDLSPDDRVLEIGCAAGEHTLRLAEYCKEVVGVDLAAAAIERARARIAAGHVPNAHFLRLDASNLDRFSSASFDKVAAIDFTEHVEDEVLAKVLRECHRVLRPDGRLAIFTPCASHYVERLKKRNIILKQIAGHIAVRGPAEYRRLLLGNGFSIDSLYFSPSTYPFFGRFDRWFGNMPIVGPLFRFRICIVARPAHSMKLVVQIPCFNEESQLTKTVRDLPGSIPGYRQHRNSYRRRRKRGPYRGGRARARAECRIDTGESWARICFYGRR